MANDTIVFEALQSLSTRGILKAGKAISLVSGGKLVAEGLIAANGEIAFEGRSFTSKGLRVSGQSVSIAGLEGASLENTEIVATKDSVKVGSLAIELGEGTVFQAGDRIVVDAKDTLTNGTSLNYTNLDLSVRNAFTNTATGLLVLDHILLNTRDAVTNAGIIYGRIDAKLSVGSLTNTSTGVINGPEIVLTVANGLTNLGQILSDRTFKLIAGDIVNDGTIQSGSELTLNAKSYRANSIAAVLVGATTELVLTEAVENSGRILGMNKLRSGAEGSIINNGAIQTEGQLTVRGQNYFSAATSILTSRKADVIALGDFENRGQILASQKLTVESLGLRNLGVASSITGANVTLIAHHDALNEGTIGAITGVSIDSGGNLLSPGSIAVGGTAPANLDADATGEGSILLTAVGNVASGGDLIASGRVAIKGAEFEANTTKARLGGSAITIDVTGVFTSLGQTTSDGDISVKAASIEFGAFDTAKTFGTLTGKSVTLEARNGDISNKAPDQQRRRLHHQGSRPQGDQCRRAGSHDDVECGIEQIYNQPRMPNSVVRRSRSD